MRQGWIFCGGMIRSGSTLQYQLASELIERQGLGRRTSYVPPTEHASALSASPVAGLSTFKTHDLTEQAAAHCWGGTGVALYIYRDLRDVMSSFQQKENIRLHGDQLASKLKEVLDNDRQWRALPKVYVSRYEYVLLDLEAEILRLADFLDIPCTDALAAKMAVELSYEKQAKSIDAAGLDGWVEVNPTNIYHRDTLLHKNHLQGGAVGRFKDDLDAGQLGLIEDIAGEWLAAQGYPLQASC